MGKAAILSIDAMGGDRGPGAVISGLHKALRADPDLHFVLHGDEAQLSALLKRRKVLAERCSINHATEVVAMDAKPSSVVRRARGSTMWRALESVARGEASSAVSCGNTGALMAMAMQLFRRAPGVDRPAIAVLWPSFNPSDYNVVLDVGADIRAEPRNYAEFAVMGAEYARLCLETPQPRVGLLNVGAEETKGGAAIRDAHTRITDAAALDMAGFDFVGYVEGNDIPSDRVDVIVTDGFTGNIALKTAEGTAALIRRLLNEAFRHTWLSRLGALFAFTSFHRLNRRIDPRRVNGGVFLGLNQAVVKSHGGADPTGIASAVGLAARMARASFAARVADRVGQLSAGATSLAVGAAKAAKVGAKPAKKASSA